MAMHSVGPKNSNRALFVEDLLTLIRSSNNMEAGLLEISQKVRWLWRRSAAVCPTSHTHNAPFSRGPNALVECLEIAKPRSSSGVDNPWSNHVTARVACLAM